MQLIWYPEPGRALASKWRNSGIGSKKPSRSALSCRVHIIRKRQKAIRLNAELICMLGRRRLFVPRKGRLNCRGNSESLWLSIWKRPLTFRLVDIKWSRKFYARITKSWCLSIVPCLMGLCRPLASNLQKSWLETNSIARVISFRKICTHKSRQL